MKKILIIHIVFAFALIMGISNVKAANKVCCINGAIQGITDEGVCRNARGNWVDSEDCYSISTGSTCKDEDIRDILSVLKKVYNLIRYVTPVILIIMGSYDMAKAVISSKEDEIQKNRKRFITRIILAIMIFMVLSIFELLTNILGSAGVGDSDSWINCWRSLGRG